MQWESGSASGRATCRQGLCERTTNFWSINAHFPVSVSDWNRFIVLQRVLYGRWQGQGEDWLSDKSFIASRVSCQFCCSYGREDEEVMGLRFCNEAVMCLTQIYPQISDNHESDRLTPLQVINSTLFPLSSSTTSSGYYDYHRLTSTLAIVQFGWSIILNEIQTGPLNYLIIGEWAPSTIVLDYRFDVKAIRKFSWFEEYWERNDDKKWKGI